MDVIHLECAFCRPSKAARRPENEARIRVRPFHESCMTRWVMESLHEETSREELLLRGSLLLLEIR